MAKKVENSKVNVNYEKPIRLGSDAPQVKAAQKMLAAHGSTIKPNGIFGIGMLSAVKAFQKRVGLKITGVIDKKTWDKLAGVKKK